MDDERLLLATANGDETALRALFEKHAPWVAGRVRRTLPPDAVEDVVQETFIAVWRNAGSYRGGGEVGAWIWGIAHRQAATWLRKHGRFSTELMLDERLATRGDLASNAVDRVDLDRALARLGPEGSDAREIARLAFFEDRPMQEIAGILGIAEGTVKSRLFKTRRLLQAALRPTEENGQ